MSNRKVREYQLARKDAAEGRAGPACHSSKLAEQIESNCKNRLPHPPSNKGDRARIVATLPASIIRAGMAGLREKGIHLVGLLGRMGLEVEWSPLLRELGLMDDVSRPSPRGETKQTQSEKSRLYAARRMGNADVRWVAMVTLTYGKTWPQDQRDIGRFLASLTDHFGKFLWAYITEFQDRGVPHYHVFIGTRLGTEWGKGWFHDFDLGAMLERETWEERIRKGKKTRILNGPISERIAETWIRIADDGTKRFRRFQMGGIVELLRSEIGSALYVAKEAAKRAQKSNRGDFRVSRWFDMARGVETVGRWVEIAEINGDGIAKCLWDSSRYRLKN